MMKRREFVKSGARTLALAGMASAAAWLVLSGKVKENGDCPAAGCQSCGKASGCKKSQVAKTEGYGKR